jgi:hypothetical protein
MTTTFDVQEKLIPRTGAGSMRATVFHGIGDIRVEEVPRPMAGPGEAVIRVTMTTICGTDLHIVRGEYRVKPGLIIGHVVWRSQQARARAEDFAGAGQFDDQSFSVL